jgi:phage terminase small subunit
MAKLTEKQKRFCEEYLIDLNATQAAIRAGYKAKTARSQGQRMLTKVDIQRRIADLMKERSDRTALTSDSVLQELSRIAMAEDVEITGKEKLKALELLGKHLGLFSTGSDNSAALEKLDEVLGRIEDNL